MMVLFYTLFSDLSLGMVLCYFSSQLKSSLSINIWLIKELISFRFGQFQVFKYYISGMKISLKGRG